MPETAGMFSSRATRGRPFASNGCCSPSSRPVLRGYPHLMRRTDPPGGVPDGHIAAFDPQPLFAILAQVDRDNHAASARCALGDVKRRNLRILAPRPPILHELVEGVLRAGFGFRASPQAVGGLVVVFLQQLDEMSDLRFLPVIA